MLTNAVSGENDLRKRSKGRMIENDASASLPRGSQDLAEKSRGYESKATSFVIVRASSELCSCKRVGRSGCGVMACDRYCKW